jgi:branched-chain amino acid transport system substrate-binding protein
MRFDVRGLPSPINFCTQVINGEVELIWPLEVRTAEPVYPKPPWD